MFKKTILAAATTAFVVGSALSGATTAAQAGGIHFSFKTHKNNAFCTPHRAVRHARHFGVRKAHVTFINHKRIVVKGFKHRKHVRLVFANHHGCPLVKF